MKQFVAIFIFILSSSSVYSQGRLSGDLMMNVNFFQRDSAIGAAGNPLYDNFLSGGEGWLGLRYADSKGFAATVRFDGFQNSNLLNPQAAYTAAGIGMFNLTKEFNKLEISAGHIYDQIGTGILFRAYEDRGLLIDNALFGLKLKYQLSDAVKVKAFTGQIKQQFTRYNPIVKGLNIEGGYGLGKEGYMTSGIGLLNRTMDQQSMDGVVSSINAMPETDRFVPTYNSYAATVYNTMNLGNFTWYVEGAYKTEEAIFNQITKELKQSDGNVLFSTLGYAINKLGLNATFKRTENFVQRTSPNETFINGMYNWQPIVAPIRVQRLISRYSPQSQDISELALGLNAYISPTKDWNINLNYTYINTLEGTKLYRESYNDIEYRGLDNWIIHLGVQVMEYNQEIYQDKPGYPLFTSVTPFTEVIYKIDKKHSMRFEGQWMSATEDYGAWLFGLLEYNISPKWAFAVTDMFNYAPSGRLGEGLEPTHYPNVFVAYTKDAHRFTAQYVKQVEGINCTGGVCRYEPAFSGFKIGVTSSF